MLVQLARKRPLNRWKITPKRPVLNMGCSSGDIQSSEPKKMKFYGDWSKIPSWKAVERLFNTLGFHGKGSLFFLYSSLE